MRVPKRWLFSVIVAIVMVVAVACGDDDDSARSLASSSSSDASAESASAQSSRAVGGDDGASEFALEAGGEEPAPQPEPEPELAEAADDGGGADTQQVSNTQLQPNSADIGRSVIFVANIAVEVDDVQLATAQAKTSIAGLGGLVFGENTVVGEATRTTLEFKVLPQDFNEAIIRLEGLGDLQSQQITADDVTERVVDLQSRIITAEASVERLRGFLDTATDSERVAELELQLLDRETTLETLRGQLRTLEDQVDLATIFLTLTEPAPPAIDPVGEFAVTYYEGDDAGASCPATGELRIDEGEQFTLCVEVINTGSNPIVAIQVRDRGLGLDQRDFRFVDGVDVEPLQPGASTFAWAALDAPSQGGSAVSVSAQAADENGDSLRVGIEFFQREDAHIEFVADDSLPGFADALDGSWDALTTMVSVLVLIVAALIPFVWIVPLGWLGARWWRRSRDSRSPPYGNSGQVPQPPAPPTTDSGELVGAAAGSGTSSPAEAGDDGGPS